MHPPRIEGLRTFVEHNGKAVESNATDVDGGTVYWQTIRWLEAQGWITRSVAPASWDLHNRPAYDLTDAGVEAWNELQDDDKENPPVTTTTEPTFRMIPLESLIPATDNPRGDEKDPELVEMAATMKEEGILQPLLVRPHPFEEGSFEIVAGHRRLKAAQMACLDDAPCIVEDPDEQRRQAVFTIENFHRKPLTPIQQARALQQGVDAGLSQRDLGTKVGMSQGHVSKLLGLLKLPENAQGWVDKGDLTQDVAGQLASLPKSVVEGLTSGNHAPSQVDVINAKGAHERAKVVEKSKKEVADKGWPVVDSYSQFVYEDNDDPVLVGGSYGSLTHVELDEHVSEPCHAVHIDHGGRIIPVCTNPSAHPAPEVERADPKKKGGFTVRDVTPDSAGDKAVVALMDAMEPSYQRAVEKAKNFSETTAVFGIAAWLRAGDVWDAAAQARDLLKIEADSDGTEDLASFIEEFEDVTGELLCALGIGATMDCLTDVVRAVADGTPLDVFDSGDPLMQDKAANARRLLDYLREVLPDDGIGTLEDIVADFAAVEEDEVEDELDPTGTGADAPTQSSTDAEAAPAGDGDATDDSIARVSVFLKGKRFLIDCSKCGQVGFNTTEDHAQARADLHIEENHPEQLAAVAS